MTIHRDMFDNSKESKMRGKTKMTDLTETQKNFIQRAVESHSQIILEEIMGVPDEMPRVPEWARNEILDLLKLLEG